MEPVTRAPGHRHDRERRLTALGRDLVEASYLEGDFALSSGERSRFYFDKYQFETKPGILRPLVSFLAELVPDGADRIVGTELGAVALATALSLETDLPFVIVRKAAKGYSTCRSVEGELRSGERVVIVEDVITTGAQAIRAAKQLVDLGARVSGILAVVDREQGGAEAIGEAGFTLTALFTRSSLGV